MFKNWAMPVHHKGWAAVAWTAHRLRLHSLDHYAWHRAINA